MESQGSCHLHFLVAYNGEYLDNIGTHTHFCCFFETVSLSIALSVLELTMLNRLVSNSQKSSFIYLTVFFIVHMLNFMRFHLLNVSLIA